MDARGKISDLEIGERLRIARETAKITQGAAAEAIEVARTTLVAIEQGQRKIKVHELQRLASLYKTSANSILRNEAVHLDLVPRFRKLSESDETSIGKAVRLLNDLVRAELELENALGITRVRNYPPERPILPGDIKAQAEDDAQALRDWLGLGTGPILDIVSILDLQMGIRVYVRKLDGKVSGLFSFDKDAGACILLNANHPVERILQTAGHEAGHFMSTRNTPEVVTENEIATSREERYANYFGYAFATPARAVRSRFAEITAGQSHLTRQHIILLAHSFGVAREAIVRRLEDLTLAKPGTWDWFQANGGITADHVKQVLGDLPERQVGLLGGRGPVPPRLALLAREAWKRELYSEGQLANILHLDRHEVREVLDGAETEESEANELVKLSY